MIQKQLPWVSPLRYAAALPDSEENWCLLYSGMDVGFSGNVSLLAFHAKESIKAEDFEQFSQKVSEDKTPYENSWFGYLGYELKNTLETLPEDADSVINLPALWMVKYGVVMVFEHDTETLTVYAEDEALLAGVPTPKDIPQAVTKVSRLASNMTRDAYLDKVRHIKDAILNGDLYQANLTRKFYGAIETQPFGLFCKLCEISPAPYSAFLKMDGVAVISSSPERFVKIKADGMMDTRPIKGSAGRFEDAIRDDISRKNLQASVKDKAENLMIVDLMRNDFSRSCEVGTVKTPSLFDITSYATVHHMASTVQGKKQQGISSIEAIKDCFPAGSMTGAPKIMAMRLCSQLEQQKRGVYSGAIGWFGGDGSVDLSVVIRTIILQGNQFEFQVGGAIVSDSSPQKEWEETLVKARAMATAMGIEMQELENL